MDFNVYKPCTTIITDNPQEHSHPTFNKGDYASTTIISKYFFSFLQNKLDNKKTIIGKLPSLFQAKDVFLIFEREKVNIFFFGKIFQSKTTLRSRAWFIGKNNI